MPNQSHRSSVPAFFRALPVLLTIIALYLSGCDIARIAKGQYYLNQRQYEQGRAEFRENLHNEPGDARAQFYMGRLFLADDMPRKGLPYLKEAVRLSPDTADYHFWLGVAYSALGKSKQEQAQYRTALSLNSRHIQARVYLGHSFLEKKQFRKALREYEEVLRFRPRHPAALYNRGLCLMHLGRKAEEKTAWLKYLSLYDSGPLARTATTHLNELGDFSYRNHVLGKRRVCLKRIDFKPFSATLDSDSKESLRRLGHFLTAAPAQTLHVLVYQAGNRALAKKKALAIKKYLLRRFPGLSRDRIRTSWFEKQEKVKVGKKRFKLDQSVNVFATKRKKRT